MNADRNVTTPILSIGLPVYNRERFIRASLDALLQQTFRNFHIIISDNASTDGTGAICQDYARRDSRIRYHRNPSNIGAPRNFNRVFELSSSPYFKWATSDDVCGPTLLEQALDVLDRNPTVVLCYAKTTIIDDDGSRIEDYDDGLHLMEPRSSDRFTKLVTTIGLCHQHQGVVRSAALRQTGLLQDHFRSDLNLLAELTLYGQFYELPERLFFRRFHSDASSWARTDVGHQLQFYDPADRHRIILHGWREHVAYLNAIRRAPIGFAEKMSLSRFILRRMIQERDYLIRELRLKGRSVASRAVQRRARRGTPALK